MILLALPLKDSVRSHNPQLFLTLPSFCSVQHEFACTIIFHSQQTQKDCVLSKDYMQCNMYSQEPLHSHCKAAITHVNRSLLLSRKKMERPFFSSHHIPPLLRVSRVKQTDPHGIKRICLSKNVAEPHLAQLCGNAPAATATCQSPSFPLPRQDQEDARLFGQSQPFIRSVPQPPQRK